MERIKTLVIQTLVNKKYIRVLNEGALNELQGLKSLPLEASHG